MFVSFAKRAPIIVLLAALLAPPAALATTDKQLQRQRGAVSYKDTAGNSHSVSGSIALSDDATAVTGRASAALLSLPDSSEVVLGETTSIKVGKFNDAVSGPGSTIAVDHGALKFAIRHPSGAKANYTFTTPTSQIAVRGTEGYLIVGEKGTQIVCTACEPGDVIVTVGSVVTSIVTGQVFTILGPSAASASTAVSTSSVLNSPAVNQFSNGANPLGGTGPSADVTGSASGSTAAGGAAAGAGAGAAGAGVASAGVAAAGALAAAAVVAASSNQAALLPPTSMPTPPPAGSGPVTITPSSLFFSQPGEQHTLTLSGPVTVMAQNPSVVTVMGAGNSFTIRALQAGTTTLLISGPGWSTRVTVNVASAGPARPHL